MPDTPTNRQHLLYGNIARLRDGTAAGDAEADFEAVFEASKGSFVVATPLRDGIANQDSPVASTVVASPTR